MKVEGQGMTRWVRWVLLSAAIIVAHGALAQPFPARAITIVVPFAPGGPGDITARMVARDLSTKLGQPVLVDNKGGAGGLIGTQAVTRAAPDGYTLLLHSSSLTSNQAMQVNPDIDVRQDLVGVTPAIFGIMGVFVNPTVPARNMQELIAYARSRPGAMNFGSSGVGSQTHLYGEMLKGAAGIDMVHVAYSGGAPSVAAALSNEVQLLVIDVGSAKAQSDAGKLRLLAVGTEQRSTLLPDVPTVAESGLPGYRADFWFGFFAPRRTPNAIVETLGAEISTILNKPEVKQNLNNRGYEIRSMSAAAFQQLVGSEVAKWEKIIKDAKIARQ